MSANTIGTVRYTNYENQGGPCIETPSIAEAGIELDDEVVIKVEKPSDNPFHKNIGKEAGPGKQAVPVGRAGKALFQDDLRNLTSTFADEAEPESLKFSISGFSYSPPAVGPDGTIYQASGDGEVRAVDRNGKQSWSFKAGFRIESSPLVGNDGAIYVGSEDNCVYAINPDGTLKWKHDTGSHADTNIEEGPDGTLYVTNKRGSIIAMSSGKRLLGQRLWKAGGPGCGESIVTQPAVSKDGRIYAGLSENKRGGKGWLVMYTPSGKEGWRSRTSCNRLDYGPAVSKDGIIYYVQNSNTGKDLSSIFAMHPDKGEVLWNRSISGAPRYGGSLLIDDEGNVSLVTQTGEKKILTTLSPSGDILRRREFAGDVSSGIPAAMGSDGSVYLSEDDINSSENYRKEYLVAVRPDGLMWKYRAQGLIKWITADKEGRVIFEDWIPGKGTYLTVIKPEKFSYNSSSAKEAMEREKIAGLEDRIQDQGEWIIIGGMKLEKKNLQS